MVINALLHLKIRFNFVIHKFVNHFFIFRL